MVIAESGEPITTIIPAQPISHRDRYSEEPVLEVRRSLVYFLPRFPLEHNDHFALSVF